MCVKEINFDFRKNLTALCQNNISSGEPGKEKNLVYTKQARKQYHKIAGTRSDTYNQTVAFSLIFYLFCFSKKFIWSLLSKMLFDTENEILMKLTKNMSPKKIWTVFSLISWRWKENKNYFWDLPVFTQMATVMHRSRL